MDNIETSVPLRVLVLEDEAKSLVYISDLVNSHPELTLIAAVSNLNDAQAVLMNSNIDVLLSDIMLGNTNSLELISNLKQKPYIVFITAHIEFASDAFDLGAVDYLMKPFNKNRFNKALDRVLLQFSFNSKTPISPDTKKIHTLNFSRTTHFIECKQLIFVEAFFKQSVLYFSDGSRILPMMIKDIELQINCDCAQRVHRSFLVNTSKIQSIRSLQGGKYMIEVSAIPGANVKEISVYKEWYVENKDSLR